MSEDLTSPVPFLFPESSPALRGLADSHAKLLASLKEFYPARAVSAVAGLMTVPEWQSTVLRLEVLQHFIVLSAAGTKKPKKADFQRWLNELGSGPVGAMEDPAEDVFVSRVLIPGEDCLIFEGVYEAAAFHVQRFVNLLEEMPDQGNYTLMKRAAYGLLKLSNEVARRSGSTAFETGGVTPLRHISEKALGNPAKLGERVRFTPDEIRALNIEPEDLSIFAFDPTKRGDLLDERIGHSTLERSPLVIIEDHLYLALPTAVSMAVRRMIIEGCSSSDMAPLLYAAYAREMHRTFEALPMLGGSARTELSFQRLKGIYVANVARYVDEGRLLHVCVVIDDLTTYAESGMNDPDPDPSRLSEAIESSISYVHAHIPKKEQFREALSLVVICPWGRPVLLDFERPNDARWRFESISAADLETLSWESSFSPLKLWRLLDGRDQLAAMNVHLMNMNGLLNLYGWSESLDGHLVPHGRVPEDYNPDSGLRVMITQNALLDIRQRLTLAWNVHYAETWDQRRVKVRREGINSYFDEDKFTPLYVSMDDLFNHQLSAVYETASRNWWTSVDLPAASNSEFHYQLWHLTAIWIRRAAPVLEQLLPTLPTGSLLWLTHFLDSGTVPPDAVIPSREEARSTLRVEVVGNVVHVHAGPGFLLASRNTTNVGESLLVEFFVRGVFQLAKVSVTDEKLAEALSAIIPDEWARDMHLVPARDFRDFVRGRIPKKPILITRTDDASSRLGLGWQSRTRDEGTVVQGIDGCCTYLGRIVDVLWDRLRRELKQYDREPLLRQLIGNHESVMIETDSWMRSARAMLSLHIDKEETALVSARRIAQYNASSLSSRILIEMALCECPDTGGRRAGLIDISRMLSHALQMHQYGGWSEAIRYEGKKDELRITPLGDIFTHVDFDQKIASPYGEALGVKRFRGGARSYENNFKQHEPVKSAKNAFENEFWEAWEESFGFTIDDVRHFMDNLDDQGLREESFVFVATATELAALEGDTGQLPKEKVQAILDALTLRPRQTWNSEPEGFAPRDWYPWRFRRRLSVISRPILQLSDDENGRYLIAPGMVRAGVVKLMEYCYRGGVEAKDFSPGRMRSWIGAAENKRGHEFNDEVANTLQELGWAARANVKLTEILNSKTDRNYGDIDVLAWRENRILAIECKDLELAMTAGEIARQLYEFRGEDDRKHRPDRLKKHLLRVDLLKQRIKDVQRFTRTGDGATVSAMLVFSDIVPMHFSEIAVEHDVELTSFDALAEI